MLVLLSLWISVLPNGWRSVGKFLVECQRNTVVGTTVMPRVVFLLNVAPGTVFCVTHRIATVPGCTTFIDAPVSHVRSHLMSVEDVSKICSNFVVTVVTVSEDALHSYGSSKSAKQFGVSQEVSGVWLLSSL